MLENLRRLVARRNKDRNESSFKRSESFKRISIRKLDRDRAKGGRKAAKRQDQPPEPELEPEPEKKSLERELPARVPVPAERSNSSASSAAAPIINYEQWMQCVRKQEQENLKELLRNRESAGSSCSPLASPSSPVSPAPRKSPASPAPSCESSRADSGLSVGLWLDGAAPRSLELPRPQVEGDPRAHRSLESAQARPRQQPRQLLPSSTSTDSGFSFSVSVPRLPDFSPAANNFFFRKRTEVFVSEPPLPPPRESRIKPKPRQRSSFLPETSLYQVVVNRPRPKALRLDPVIFVPPERRRPTDTVRRRLEVREVRDYCSPRDLRPVPDEDLYESLDEEHIYRSTDSDSDSSLDYAACASDYTPLVEESSSCSEIEFDDSPCHTPRRPPARLRSRRGPRLLVRPTIHRAPSTLKKKKKSPKRTQAVVLDLSRIDYLNPGGGQPSCSWTLAATSPVSDLSDPLEMESVSLDSVHLEPPRHWGPSRPLPPLPFPENTRPGHSLVDLEQLYIWLQQFEGPCPLQPSPSNSFPGDITQKGYEKKRTRLLASYVPKQSQGGSRGGGSGSCSPTTRARRRGNRKLTRNESRYHSEVRQEAVQQALAAMQTRPKPSLPMPSKRTSVMAPNTSNTDHLRDSASSSDEDSVGLDRGNETPERERVRAPAPLPPHSDTSSASSTRETPPHKHHRMPNGGQGGWDDREYQNDTRDKRSRDKQEITDLSEIMHNFRPYCPPDVTHNTAGVPARRLQQADRVNRYNQSRQSSDDSLVTGTGRWKVSAKIQQLLNTLKRPKRRPLPEFYEDDDIELEIAANPKDPNAPKPEGNTMTSTIGEQLVVPSGLPRNLEAAIQRYGSATYKAPVATVLDPNGKLTITLTYGKLLSRSLKIAYTLLTKTFSKGSETCSIKCGDRVALVYPNNDPINFMCAFYGCMFAGIVPVPIEVPLTRRDAGSQQIGFLLGSCGVQLALTSEACLKGLPKTAAGDVVSFKGWPRLQWFVTEHLAKTPKDWSPSPRLSDDTPAYIEYTTDKDGSVMGVTVSRSAMLQHCRMLTAACNYTEGENMVCVLDFKRETGLWHSVLSSVLNGMHVVFIPYALMKVNPASWMHMITKYRASVAVVKSRDLHWGLLATKDHKEVSLSSLRLLLVGDGANPWSLSSCDQFLSVFQAKGLRPDAICPSASSTECLTVSIRRPGRGGVNATGRGVLSMSGLSYGVVRVDQENSLTSLTLQDCGQVMPASSIVVVKLEGPSILCKTDEVGEICVQSGATGGQYWGLQGLTQTTFRVRPMSSDAQPLPDTQEYVRSGLIGFLGPGGLVFVCGSRDGLMTVTGRKHNADDIIATVLAVEPMKFIYRGRIAVYSIRLLRDERICVIAEQRPDCSEEESFQWMSRVLQAVDSIHQVGIYCLALVPPNYLPKTPLGGIHLSEVKRKFLEGTLHPANVLLCPHTCVTNLPKPREIHSDIGPASVMVGNIVQGNRLASAMGRDMGVIDEDSDSARKFISEILRWRAVSTSDHVIFTLLNSKGGVATALSCAQLHKRAERIGSLLSERAKINKGDHVALIFPPGIDLICAFYGCLYVGAVPVTIRPPHPQNLQTTLPTVRMIVDVSKSVLVLSNQNVIKLLKSKEAGNVVDSKSWPVILDTDDMPKKKLAVQYRAPTAEMLAYLDFSVSTTGMLAGIKMSHAGVTSLCRSMKLACELYPSRHVALCLDPYCGLGFALWVLSSVYSGHHTILIPPSEVEANPALWLTAVSQYRVRDTFSSYGVMELCTKGLGSSVNQLKARGVSLACVRTCVVVAEERPRINLTTSFSKLFSALGLSPRAVSTTFGCRVNVAICLQGASSPEPSCVYVDLRALRNDRVSLVERGAPHSLCLLESGKLLPGVKLIIANPETKGQCGDSHLGEIWVQAPHNASGYFSVYGEESEYGGQFGARLVTGATGEVYARTGYLGFLRRSTPSDTSASTLLPELTDISTHDLSQTDPTANPALNAPELHDAVFVVGALDETIMLRGMRYHPIDIENSVMRCHKKIAECAVFTWTNLLVVVVELDGAESEALDLVPLVTNAVLEEHHLVVGVAVVTDPGVVPINSRGEKQRMHLRDGFLADQLDPIYVAYNM